MQKVWKVYQYINFTYRHIIIKYLWLKICNKYRRLNNNFRTFFLLPGSRLLIDSTTYSGILVPGIQWHTLTHNGPVASITYRVRVVCDEHYYNTTCNKLCRPRADQFGHYSCNATGDKVCVDGWSGATCEKRELKITIYNFSKVVCKIVKQ